MAVPTTRATFKETCLRRLGQPVIKVNVSDEQVDDRVDYALARFRDYHWDGSTKTYIPVQVTDEDKTNGYVTLGASVIEVVGVFPMVSSLMGVGMWNVTYQYLLTSVELFSSIDIANWVMQMQHLQQIQSVLVGQQPTRFNRYDTKLYVDTAWDRVATGDFIIVEAYVVTDSASATKLWSDPWLLQYGTAQIKQAWGANLKKYSGMQMPGGISFNGQQIFDEATEEIAQLEARVITDYSQPLGIYVG